MIKIVDPNRLIVEVKDFGRRPTNYKDISAILFLMGDLCKKNFVEIGSWYGKTTYEIATRFPWKTIWTMDYMEDDLILNDHGMKTRAAKEDLCKYAKDLDNVIFIYANAHVYDFNKFINVDFFFIDGDHSFSGVKIDTEKAVKYLKKNGGGTIVWHDVHTKVLTQVPDYMKHLAKTQDIYYIANSNIGYWKI
jgi:hypothetical protein